MTAPTSPTFDALAEQAITSLALKVLADPESDATLIEHAKARLADPAGSASTERMLAEMTSVPERDSSAWFSALHALSGEECYRGAGVDTALRDAIIGFVRERDQRLRPAPPTT